MRATVMITGSTDGIGLEAAARLAARGHRVLLHGRRPERLEAAARRLEAEGGAGVEGFVADLSRPAEVERLASEIAARGGALDALVHNAGVYRAAAPRTRDGLDVRFVVNAIAPYLLTRRLLASPAPPRRVVSVASAAQRPVDPEALAGRRRLPDMEAYAQSKLAMIMWTRALAEAVGEGGPVMVAVNPGSLLATKMVREGFGMEGRDVGIGARTLARAALDPAFAEASGRYYDADAGRFAPPHPHALDRDRCREVVAAIEAVLARLGVRLPPLGGAA